MADLLDQVLSKLSPAVLDLLKNDPPSKKTSQYYDEKLHKSLEEVEMLKVERCVRELENKIEWFKAQTRENDRKLNKYRKELELWKELDTSLDKQKVSKNDRALSEHITALEQKFKHLTAKSNNDPVQLFDEIKQLFEKGEKCKKELQELEKKLECYGMLPPNIEQAKEAISNKQEVVKQKELQMEKNFLN